MEKPALQEHTSIEGAQPSASGGRRFVTIKGQEDASKPPIGAITCFIHLVKGYVGTGIFAMGEAFKNSGIVLGSILLLLIAIMNLYCQHVLIKSCIKIASEEEEDVRPSYAETVEYTLEKSAYKRLQSHSKRLGSVTNIFLCITELGFCCVYFVFIAEHLIEITSAYGFLDKDNSSTKYIMLAIILGPMWLSTFLGNLKLLFPLSLFANFLTWSGMIMILYFIVRDEMTPIDKIQLADHKRLPMFFGTCLFAFEGITFILPLRNEMKTPKHFTATFGVLNLGMTFVYILMTAAGVLAYWKYGEKVASSVFLNLPEHEVLSFVIQGVIALAVVFTFTLHMYIPFEITYPLFERKYGPFKHNILVKALYRSAFVLVTYILANAIPFLGLFISLVGASTASFLALIIPPLLYQVAFQGKLRLITVVINWSIIAVGFLGAIAGTSMSVYNIVMEIRKKFYGDGKNSTSS